MKFSKMNLNDFVKFKSESIDYDLEDGMIKEIRLISTESIVKIKCDYAQLLIFEKSPQIYKEIYTVKAIDKYGANVLKDFLSKNEADEFVDSTNYKEVVIESRSEKVDG